MQGSESPLAFIYWKCCFLDCWGLSFDCLTTLWSKHACFWLKTGWRVERLLHPSRMTHPSSFPCDRTMFHVTRSGASAAASVSCCCFPRSACVFFQSNLDLPYLPLLTNQGSPPPPPTLRCSATPRTGIGTRNARGHGGASERASRQTLQEIARLTQPRFACHWVPSFSLDGSQPSGSLGF